MFYEHDRVFRLSRINRVIFAIFSSTAESPPHPSRVPWCTNRGVAWAGGDTTTTSGSIPDHFPPPALIAVGPKSGGDGPPYHLWSVDNFSYEPAADARPRYSPPPVGSWGGWLYGPRGGAAWAHPPGHRAPLRLQGRRRGVGRGHRPPLPRPFRRPRAGEEMAAKVKHRSTVG